MIPSTTAADTVAETPGDTDAPSREVVPRPDELHPGTSADRKRYCPRCGNSVASTATVCPDCGHELPPEVSLVQRYSLMASLGFIFVGGVFVFLQPKQYHTIPQDVFEGFIILSVIGAGVSFFIAVVDMVRRGGE